MPALRIPENLKRHLDLVAGSIIVCTILAAAAPALVSGDKVNFNNDFFQYAARHEAVRKSIFEHHTLPLRSHWLGGGYPTIGDPEDPTLNPLVLLTILFGTVYGLKIIGVFAILTGGLGTYALCRAVLGYDRWGSLFSGLTFGLSLFVPLRIADGNSNEVYAAFIPLCLLLIGLACRGKRAALYALPLVFYTMMSDGKLTFLMAVLYLFTLCLLELVPSLNVLSIRSLAQTVNWAPLKVLIFALLVTLMLGMVRVLPAIDVAQIKGSVWKFHLSSHQEGYSPRTVSAYTATGLWKAATGFGGTVGNLTVGWGPIVLSVIALTALPRFASGWGIILLLFAWLFLAYNAPLDLLKFLFNLPIFNAIYRPYKYFGFQIVFTLSILAGSAFILLRQLRRRWLGHLAAAACVLLSVSFLFPRNYAIHQKTFTDTMPAGLGTTVPDFYQILGVDLRRNRVFPLAGNTYANLLRNIGTIDWYTGMALDENAVPRYLVDRSGIFLPNPGYRGEVHAPGDGNSATADFHPNSIDIVVDFQRPGRLTINQNYHGGWKTNRGRIVDRDGLLGLDLTERGRYGVHLRYRPVSFVLGLAVSLLTVVLMAALWWADTRGLLHSWATHPSPLLRRGSRALLWLLR